MANAEKAAVRLAGMLLLGNGRITLEDIRSLPFVDNDEQALHVANRLIETFDTEYEVEVHSNGPDAGATLTLPGRKRRAASAA